MKYPLAAMALVFANVSVAFASSANTLTFLGEIADQTCEVAVNGVTSNPAVVLPAVSASTLATGGSTAGQTTFRIGISGCTAPIETAQAIRTVFVGNRVTASGNLDNSGTAENVSLQLVDPAAPNQPFNLSGPDGHAAPGLNLRAGETAASYDFAVRYVSETGGATRGSVKGSVQYLLTYQ
ncbi:fimbrial protein [Burkholderia guangdongensis]|uniref:fimbrial protein n=1 Tax=Burkholderia guangdongensis TaxID=1792500 RepID=UPI0015CBBC37|nr:fimbrial protein [Burkholderia guangdongensis]